MENMVSLKVPYGKSVIVKSSNLSKRGYLLISELQFFRLNYKLIGSRPNFSLRS